jgi:hypothetical protein
LKRQHQQHRTEQEFLEQQGHANNCSGNRRLRRNSVGDNATPREFHLNR